MVAESLIGLVGLLSVHAAHSSTPVLALHDLPLAKYVAAPITRPIKKNPDSYGVEVSAKAATILDVGSGEVLFQKDADTTYPVASLTKLLTVMTFLDTKPNLDEEMTLQPEDDPHEGQEVFLPNERLTKRELLRAALVGSVNTAANALARSTGNREDFMKALNEKARALGMWQAHFADPVGLDAHNQASAKEMAFALRAALSYPEIREVTELDHVEIKGRTTGKMYLIKTTNLLLNSFLNRAPYRIVAGKTGSLPEAGFCLAQDTRDQFGNEIIVVVLGSENHFARFQDAKALTAWAFGNFEWAKKAAQVQELSLR